MGCLSMDRRIALFSLLLTCSQGFSAQVIYGLENARQFHTAHQGPFLVQVGTFRHAHLAIQLKAQLDSRFHYPVYIRHSGEFHQVVIGPLLTASLVREVAKAPSSQKKQHVMPSVSLKPKTSSLAETPLLHAKPSYHPTPPLHPTLSINTSTPASWFVEADAGDSLTFHPGMMSVDNGSGLPPSTNVDHYSMTRHFQPLLGFQVGRRWTREEEWIPFYNVGLRYQHLFNQNLSGDITQYSLPEFNNYTYQWGVSFEVLSLHSKVDIMKWEHLLPYVDADLGVSFNHQTKPYQETPKIGITPRISPGYTASHQGQFSYTLGVGLDWEVNSQVILSAGYDYQSFGQLSSGQGQSTWAGRRLNSGNLTSNTVLMGLTYLLEDPFKK